LEEGEVKDGLLKASLVVLMNTLVMNCVAPISLAQGQPPKPMISEEARAKFEALRKQAFDAFYNLDYDTSKQLFQQIVELLPEHSAGYLYNALQIWVNELNRTRRLQTGIYSQSSFYSKTEEKVDPQIDQQFRDHLQTAINKATAWLNQNDKDIEARYFLGAAHAVLAGYEATIARRFMAALKGGSRAFDEHEKVVKQNPEFADAYLTVGMYHYVVGSLPLVVKILAALGGIRGSKEQGIKELLKAATEGKHTSDDARTLLIAIYVREGRHEKALELARELAGRYPRNYYFRIEAANILVRMGRKQEGFQAFEELLQGEQYRPVSDLIHSQYAETLASLGYTEAALYRFQKVTTLPQANPQLVTLAHLRAGQILDTKGDREAAIKQYQAVLSRENVFDSHEQAEQYLRKPYGSNSP
jgi:tetratricopeptide (TPR) repeat protein